MNEIPGFTAEAALYKTNDYYHAVIETTHASGVVQPALIKMEDWIKCITFRCRWHDISIPGQNPRIVRLCDYEWIC